MKDHNRKEFQIAKDRMDRLEDSIKKEIKDRVVETDEIIYVVRTDLNSKLIQNETIFIINLKFFPTYLSFS